jgi:hypothetical protein
VDRHRRVLPLAEEAAFQFDCGPDDTACAMLGSSPVAVVLGRKGRPFRSRERRQLAALARIAGARAGALSSPANA